MIVILPLCGMVLMAVLAAYRQQQKRVLKWLIPLAVGHAFSFLLALYDFSFRYFHLKADLASTVTVYGFGVVGALLSLYITWRILEFVNHLPIKGALTQEEQEEGVWPPPPTQTR
jgi:4-amino-4-deoxy-L-arabinose transferase-like glycosyltransferase